MAEPARRRATYDDIVALPEHVVGEIVDGDLVVSPRPAARHANAAGAVHFDLTGPFQRGRGGPGGWWFLFEPELHLGADVLVPDLAGWRRERFPAIPDVPYFTLAPDWVCEVLSPSTAALDRARKLPIYARAQIAHAWLVDPAARTLEVFRRDGERWLLAAVHSGNVSVRAEPFDAVAIDLGALWLGEPA